MAAFSTLDPSWAPVCSAFITVFASLGAVWLTQHFNERARRDQYRREDEKERKREEKAEADIERVKLDALRAFARTTFEELVDAHDRWQDSHLQWALHALNDSEKERDIFHGKMMESGYMYAIASRRIGSIVSDEFSRAILELTEARAAYLSAVEEQMSRVREQRQAGGAGRIVTCRT